MQMILMVKLKQNNWRNCNNFVLFSISSSWEFTEQLLIKYTYQIAPKIQIILIWFGDYSDMKHIRPLIQKL